MYHGLSVTCVPCVGLRPLYHWLVCDLCTMGWSVTCVPWAGLLSVCVVFIGHILLFSIPLACKNSLFLKTLRLSFGHMFLEVHSTSSKSNSY